MTSPQKIVIRPIESHGEIDECVALQREVWQFPDLDLVPRRMFVVARSVGGQIFGAWDGEALAGYALAVPGMREGKPYLHSHMLAVRAPYRDQGIGYRLKLAQRDDALSRGIDRIEWTFDPVQGKNARFNIEKLGAIARRYTPDFYGHSKSPVHGNLPTDRLHAEWWLGSARVQAAVSGSAIPAEAIQRTVAVTNTARHESGTLREPVETPLQALLNLRQNLLRSFAAGLAVLRFEFRANGQSAYLLGPWEDREEI